MSEERNILLQSIRDHEDAINKAKKKLKDIDRKTDFELNTYNGQEVTIKAYIARTNQSICISHSNNRAWIKLDDVRVYANGLLDLIQKAYNKQIRPDL